MFQDTFIRKVLGFVGAAAVIALLAYTYATLSDARYKNVGPTVITVTGLGEVTAIPDIATFTLSVNAREEDAASAKSKSAETINAILAYLREQGIEERDIKTSYYSLSPRYEYERQPCPVGSYCPPGEQQLVGWEVTQTLEVKVRNVDDVGMLLSGVAELGATNVSGPTLTIDDDERYKSEAREQAIAKAQAKAVVLAEDLGVRLVRMTGYWENEGPMPYYGMGLGGAEMKADVAMAPVPEIPVGENTIVSSVSLSYLVR
jgi:hypothetical protein